MPRERLPGLAPQHPVFAGHFPGRPIVPGVLLLDAVLHAIARAQGIEPARCTIGSIKFLSPVQPGEDLDLQHADTPGGQIRFDLFAGARKVAAGSLLISSAASAS